MIHYLWNPCLIITFNDRSSIKFTHGFRTITTYVLLMANNSTMLESLIPMIFESKYLIHPS